MRNAARTHSRFDAAIFDFDETMVNLESQHRDADEALCARRGARYLDIPADMRNRSGMRVIDEIAGMKDFFNWSDPLGRLVEERARLFIETLSRSEVELLPGVGDLVSALRRRGLLLAVTSSGMRDYIELVLRRFDLTDCFNRVVAGDQVSKPKPDPEPYLKTAELLGVGPGRCVVFEDSSVGVEAAKAAGMYCVAVRNLYVRSPQDLARADRIVTTLREVEVESLLS
ncbi:MAG TPA: HAD family phosphatase [Thermoanaerobaculia bacterium]|nr:HAD family phosphatase [Thermoanaerobaculia bacterium]